MYKKLLTTVDSMTRKVQPLDALVDRLIGTVLKTEVAAAHECDYAEIIQDLSCFSCSSCGSAYCKLRQMHGYHWNCEGMRPPFGPPYWVCVPC